MEDLGESRLAASMQAEVEGKSASTLPTQSAPPAPIIPINASAALWHYYESRPAALKVEAERRLRKVQDAEALWKAGRSKEAACAKVAGEDGASTVLRWWNCARKHDRKDWLAALIPQYQGPGPSFGNNYDPRIWDWWKADYLRQEHPTAESCWERVKRLADASGLAMPSSRTLVQRTRREFSAAAIRLARFGPHALKRGYPYQERDRSVFHAMEAVNADGHRWDVWVKWPDGEIARPCMVVVQDLFSGKIVSWRVDKTENADSVRLAFHDMFRDFGIPAECYLDNGRGFASKWMTGQMGFRFRFKRLAEEPAGILTILNVKVHWTTPYHGQAKPIERAFGDFCQRISTHPAFAGAWTGPNTTEKPENYGGRTVALDSFLKVCATEIIAHNARLGRRAPTCAGKSFDQVFGESYSVAPITKATSEQLRMCMLAAESTCADRDGVITLFGNRYWSEQIAQSLAGQRVIARFDPQSLHSFIEVSRLNGVYAGRAQCLQAAGFNDTQAAREHGRARNQWMRAQKQMLAAERRMDTLEYADQLPEMAPPPAPESKVVRPIRPDLTPDPFPKGKGKEFEERINSAVLEMNQLMRGNR
jgi:putative transposase